MTQAAFSAVVSGRVQLVMYRDFTTRKARSLGLTGEVRNLPDGRVAVVAEGSKQNLEALLESLKKGPLLSQVENVSVQWTEPSGTYSGFSIRYA